MKEPLTRDSPVPIARLLALKNWSRPFSITTDRPKVTSRVMSTLRSSALWMIVRCSA